MSADSAEESIAKIITPSLSELYVILLDGIDKPYVYIVSVQHIMTRLNDCMNVL